MKMFKTILRWAGTIALWLVAALAVAGLYFTRERWLPLVTKAEPADKEVGHAPLKSSPQMLKLTRQARKNLQLTTAPAATQEYWRKVRLPGVVEDRPGVSDRGVTSPVDAVVAKVHAFAGDTVEPGQKLFTLRLVSESLHESQTGLFKAMREQELIAENLKRIEGLANQGIGVKKRVELNQEKRRQEVLIASHKLDLARHGLTPSQIAQVSRGQFVTTVEVTAPSAAIEAPAVRGIRPVTLLEKPVAKDRVIYELQDLVAGLGQQVQAGQMLCMLSNHRQLYVEGHAFRREAVWLARAAEERREIEVEFDEEDAGGWADDKQKFHIRYLANTIDASSRTFDFYLPLTNQARIFENTGQTFVVWRFRPGQRVQLLVPVERYENVIVLPAAAVVREGPEAYVFRQNGDLFNRLPVHVLHEDQKHIVIKNDGSITLGTYLAQGSAASLNRVMKAQAASGMKVNVHVHADGTVHEAH